MEETIIAVAAAALGFVVRTTYDRLVQRKDRYRMGLESLREFEAMVNASRSAFVAQCRLRDRLVESLRSRDLDPGPNNFTIGFIDRIAKFHDEMLDAEKELFDMVKGITEHSINLLNKSMLDWAMANNASKLFWDEIPEGEKFDEQLGILREHLTLWFSRYHSVFKIRPNHCLVYLADEKNSGVGFPKELAPKLSALIKVITKEHTVFYFMKNEERRVNLQREESHSAEYQTT